MSKKIVLTGGGTAGHVTPNIALIPELKKAGYEISYIGSKDGIEKRLIEDYNIPYYGVSTGKFLSESFTDLLKPRQRLKRLNPTLFFQRAVS